MHNLFLGTAKNVFSLWKEKGILNEPLSIKIQQKVDLLIGQHIITLVVPYDDVLAHHPPQQ